MRHTIKLAGLAVTGALALAACGGSSSDNPAVSGAQTAASTTTVVAASGATTPTTAATATTAATPTTEAPTATTAPAATKVSANNASQAELQKAFEAAGISNASRWVTEVMEYRPYPTNDPTFAKLRQNLAKYNPAPGLVDQIIATLSL
jgi:DNA uptake protein ComE-like DNA-binding protein